MRTDLLPRDSPDSSLSYELSCDNCVWEYFKSTKIPGWQCHTSPILGIDGSLLPHFAPLMIFPESVTGFSELKASPLPGLWNFFLARGQDCSLPVTQSWQEGRDFLKNTLHVSSWASYPHKPLLPGIRDRLGNLEKEEGGKFQIFADLFLELAVVGVKRKEKNSEFSSPTDKRWDKQMGM